VSNRGGGVDEEIEEREASRFGVEVKARGGLYL
jgi:hypothetical protein